MPPRLCSASATARKAVSGTTVKRHSGRHSTVGASRETGDKVWKGTNQQGVVAAHAALVRTGSVTPPAQPVLPAGPDPAVDCVAPDHPRLAVGAHLLLAGEPTDDQAALSAPDPVVDQVIAHKGRALLEVVLRRGRIHPRPDPVPWGRPCPRRHLLPFVPSAAPPPICLGPSRN